MSRSALLAVALVAAVSHGKPPATSNVPLAAAPAPAPQRTVAPIKGVALGMFAEDVSFSYQPLLAEIVALGATDVALVVPLYQTNGATDDLALDTRLSPTLAAIAEAARAAHRDGLDVTLFPIVRLWAARDGEWRGTLAPRDRAAWFRHYGDLLGELAAIGAVTGAKRLVVGSELSTLDFGERDLGAWRPLIERVRAVFAGRLIYSANWDHFREARLLDLVDEDGVSAYFKLREATATADDGTLEAGWRRVRRDIEAWHAGRPQPLVFTELGYRSRAGSTAAPWDETPGGVVNLDEQRRAFAAFRRVWMGAPTLDGIFVWNWYGYGGPTSTSYTPRGKPAEVEVRLLLKDL